MVTRREFVKGAAVFATASLFRLDPSSAASRQRPFRMPLRIPPVAVPSRSDDGSDLYEVVMRRARVSLLSDKRTVAWTFDGAFPGPTIKATRGREVVVRRFNRLDVPSSVHLHGAKVAAHNDGHPTDVIDPGDVKEYSYPNDQPGATLWYHDHTHHHTSRNNYRGLSGLYIIEDPDEEELNLPKGKHDIPLVLQDRSFRADASFRFRSHHDSVTGNSILVNGRPAPFFKVANRRYRFRILNASNSRGYSLALDPTAPLIQIASDGGLLAAPAPTSELTLFPAERADVVIDFAQFPVGSSVLLQDVDPADPSKKRAVLRFDISRGEPDPSSIPASLGPVERLVPDGAQREFNLSLDVDRNRWVINGKIFNPDRIDVRPQAGATELWTFRNQSSTTHPMHIHLVQFQILQRSNMAVALGEAGWKDTVRVDPSATVQLAVRFPTGYSGRYMIHCHNLAHEDHSMMAQMLVA